MNYTKGEWKVTDSGFQRFSTSRRNREGGRRFVTDDNLGLIAEVQGDTQEEADANARLISVAPKLLEVLKKIIDSPIGEELPNKNELLDLIAKAGG